MPKRKYPVNLDPKTTPELKSTTKVQLKKVAKQRGLKGYSQLNKEDLVEFIKSQRVKSKSASPKQGKLYYGVDLDQIPVYSQTPPPPYSSYSLTSKSPPPPYSPSKSPSVIDLISPSTNKGKMEKSSSSSKSPSPKEKYIRKIGPLGDEVKYGLISVLGKGKYGSNYRAKNLNKQQGENDYYAVKVLEPSSDINEWMKETMCLINILKVCTQVGILCYKDSFVYPTFDSSNKFEKMEYVIVSELLEGYQSLASYLYNPQTYEPYGISEDEAFDIYQQIVDVKNELTALCINHSDLHLENIMIHPKTGDIKVIDLGRCQTPEEELKEWGYGTDKWNSYSDESRFVQLRRALYNAAQGSYHINLNWPNDEPDDFFSMIKVKPSIPNCKREALPPNIRLGLNEHLTKLANLGVPV